MMDSTLSINRYICKWNINYFKSCLIYTEGSMKSPQFQVRNPMSSWLLELNVSAAHEFQIRLCRQFMPVGPSEINVRFLLNFKTLHGTEIWESESWLSFPQSTSSEFEHVPLILETDDTVVVTCDMILTVDEPWYFIDQNFVRLSEDIKRVFSSSNSSMESATLIVGEQKRQIKVLKDILCAHSTVLNNFFRCHDGEFPIRNYSPEVIISMIKFLYYGDIADLTDDIFALWSCAMELGVSHLVDFLRPNFLLTTSEFKLQNIELRWNYSNFTETNSTKLLVDDTRVQMFDIVILECRVEFKATMYVYMTKKSTTSSSRGSLFCVEMGVMPAFGRFSMEMSIRDNEDRNHFQWSKLIMLNSDGTFHFPIWIENSVLFGTGNDSFPRHAKFNLKFEVMLDLPIQSVSY